MGTLEIKLFGTLRVQRPGQPVRPFPTRRVKDLFAYLLLHRHELHSREALADLFWDGATEGNPRHCLNTTLWRLQRVLGDPEPGGHPYLRVDARRIGFNDAGDCRLDVAEFEHRCAWAAQLGDEDAAQRAALYHQALAFYQADLLVDCYEEWCLRERERLQQTALRALEVLVDYHAARDEPAEAIACASRLLGVDPLREDVHRKLIRLYVATGQAGAARRQFQTCRTVLQRELGVSPTRETQDLLPHVLNAGSDAPAPGPQDAFQSLQSAATRFRAAMAGYDRAHAELRAAATTLDEVMQGLVNVAPAPATPQASAPDSGVPGARGAGRKLAPPAARPAPVPAPAPAPGPHVTTVPAVPVGASPAMLGLERAALLVAGITGALQRTPATGEH